MNFSSRRGTTLVELAVVLFIAGGIIIGGAWLMSQQMDKRLEKERKAYTAAPQPTPERVIAYAKDHDYDAVILKQGAQPIFERDSVKYKARTKDSLVVFQDVSAKTWVSLADPDQAACSVEVEDATCAVASGEILLVLN